MASATAGLRAPVQATSVLRHWQHFVHLVSVELGCLAIDTDVLARVRLLKEQNAKLLQHEQELDAILAKSKKEGASYSELLEELRTWRSAHEQMSARLFRS